MSKMKKPIKVLTFSGYYLPGYKGGGPVRTIENMITQLSDSGLEFWVITRDRDLGDSRPYPSVKIGKWEKLENFYVYYLPAEKTSYSEIHKIIKKTEHDIVYLNSFFDTTFTIIPLIYKFFSCGRSAPFILAPRGEFSPAALKIKRTKKKVYLAAFRLLRLNKNLTFQASSQFEADDIKNAIFADKNAIKIAPDLPSMQSSSSATPEPKVGVNTDTGPLRVIFLSRISPMKNLDFAITALAKTKCDIQFDIFGPKEDLAYWQYCEQLLSSLPNRIQYQYCGTVLPVDVKGTFSEYDLFLFPTQGENYGHVIAESISAGTPVLLSDRTPWRTLEADNLGWVLPLDAPSAFAETIDTYSKTSLQEKQEKRAHMLKFSEHQLCAPETISQNRNLFFSLVQENNEL